MRRVARLRNEGTGSYFAVGIMLATSFQLRAYTAKGWVLVSSVEQSLRISYLHTYAKYPSD